MHSMGEVHLAGGTYALNGGRCPRHHILPTHLGVLSIGKMGRNQKLTLYWRFFAYVSTLGNSTLKIISSLTLMKHFENGLLLSLEDSPKTAFLVILEHNWNLMVGQSHIFEPKLAWRSYIGHQTERFQKNLQNIQNDVRKSSFGHPSPFPHAGKRSLFDISKYRRSFLSLVCILSIGFLGEMIFLRNGVMAWLAFFRCDGVIVKKIGCDGVIDRKCRGCVIMSKDGRNVLIKDEMRIK